MRNLIFTQTIVAATVVISFAQVYLQWSTWQEQRASNPKLRYQDVQIPYFRLVPRYILKMPWTWFTAAFTETQTLTLILFLPLLLVSSRYFERIWGARSLLKYIGLASVPPVLISAVIYLLISLTRPNEDLLDVTIGGSASLVMALLVAFKQAIPLHTIVLFKGVVRIPIKYMVMPTLLAYTLAGIVSSPMYLYLAWTGFVLGWWYLRFVKSIVADSLLPADAPTILKGDKSDAFAFAKFFYPLPVTNAVASASSLVFEGLVAAGLVRPFETEQVSASNTRVQTSESGRHRALGLQVLGQ